MGNTNDDGVDHGPPSRSTSAEGTSTTLVLQPNDDPTERCDQSGLSAPLSATNVLVVSHTQTTVDVVRRWRSAEGEPASFGLISFAEFDRSTAAESAPSKRSLPGQNITVTTMSDPSDLQGLGTAVTLYLDDWAENDRETLVCLDSLETLLDENGTQPTFQFLHVLTGCVRRAGASLTVHLDGRRTGRAVDTLRPLFDEVVDRTEVVEPLDIGSETICSLLGNARRKYVLYYLFNEAESVSLGTLTTRLARWENDATEYELTAEQCDRAYTALASVHLPNLADSGVIKYDTDEKRVTLSAGARQTDRLQRYVELSFDDDEFQ